MSRFWDVGFLRAIIIKSAMLTEAQVLTALRDCYDPELPCNIVDLGLIRSIAITPDLDAPGSTIPGVPQKHCIEIQLTLTNPTEAAEAQLRAQIINRLAGLEAVGQTTVDILSGPVWTPGDITPAGRRVLGLDGNPNLIQIR
jgi:metal-sulfur cluster biosynthetic enzyme